MLDEVVFPAPKITLGISIPRRRQTWQTVPFYRSSQNSGVLVFIAATLEESHSGMNLTLDIPIPRRRQIWQTVSSYRSSQNSDVSVFIAARGGPIYVGNGVRMHIRIPRWLVIFAPAEAGLALGVFILSPTSFFLRSSPTR